MVNIVPPDSDVFEAESEKLFIYTLSFSDFLVTMLTQKFFFYSSSSAATLYCTAPFEKSCAVSPLTSGLEAPGVYTLLA